MKNISSSLIMPTKTINFSEENNYFILNNIKEQIELKNTVQTKGVFMYKDRFAILTTNRLLIFETKDKFLHKKPPRKSFVISENEFSTNGRILNIQNKEMNTLRKQIFFSNTSLCVQWWETIKHFKLNNETQVQVYIEEAKQSSNLNTSEILDRRSLIDNSFNISNNTSNQIIRKNSEAYFYSLNNVKTSFNKSSFCVLPSVSNSCFEIIPKITNQNFKLESFAHTIRGSGKFQPPCENKEECDEIYINEQDSSNDTISIIANSIPHHIPKNSLNKKLNIHEFSPSINTRYSYSESTKTKFLDEKDEEFLRLNTSEFKKEGSINKINILEKKNSQIYFLIDNKNTKNKDRVLGILKNEFGQKSNLSKENKNKIVVKYTPKKSIILNKFKYSNAFVSRTRKNSENISPKKNYENGFSMKNNVNININKFTLINNNNKIARKINRTSENNDICIIRRLEDDYTVKVPTKKIENKFNIVKENCFSLQENDGILNKKDNIEIINKSLGSNTTFYTTNTKTCNAISTNSTNRRGNVIYNNEEKSLIEITLSNYYNENSFDNALKNNNHESGINKKIKLILDNLFSNTKNSSAVIKRFLRRFPFLLKKAIEKYNIKIFLLPNPNHKKLDVNICKINSNIIKLICNDIKYLSLDIVNFIHIRNFNLIEDIEIYKKRFILEMNCLKALVLLKS